MHADTVVAFLLVGALAGAFVGDFAGDFDFLAGTVGASMGRVLEMVSPIDWRKVSPNIKNSSAASDYKNHFSKTMS